jgi:hypothetical protein
MNKIKYNTKSKRDICNFLAHYTNVSSITQHLNIVFKYVYEIIITMNLLFKERSLLQRAAPQLLINDNTFE